MNPSAARPLRRTLLCGLLVAVAFILSYLEHILPFPMPIPGLKLGLANLVMLFAVYHLTLREGALILLARCLLSAALFGSPSQLVFSLGGGLLALVAMWGLSRLACVSPLGAGIGGAAAHNIGQVAVAAAVLRTPALIGYLAVLLPAALVTGALIALAYQLFARALAPALNQFLGNAPKAQTGEATFTLKELSLEDGKEAYAMLQGIEKIENGFHNVVKDLPYEAFPAWLKEQAGYARGEGLAQGWVPQSTYWLLRKGTVVGIGRVRHHLNDALRQRGGHVGYAIAAPHRARGAGNAILPLLLEECHKKGIDEVHINVLIRNSASEKIILKHGGSLVREEEGMRHYIIKR